MPDDKVQFGSDQWLFQLQQILTRLVDEADFDIDSQSVRICEVVTNVPPELRSSPDEDTRAWHIIVDGRSAKAGPGAIDDVDFSSVSEYESILTLARWVYSDDEADQAAVSAHRLGLERSGVFSSSGDLSRLARPMHALLRELHNSLARITA